MPLKIGSSLGPYTVMAKIGQGGMGEVFRARDTTLDRDVALKVLPPAFTDDPDRLARFEREAKLLASLNHPNLGHIYGLEEAEGTRALVLELVEGPTLADRIAQGPIPVDEVLPITTQIAQALEAAHAQGIIHRDLKPANIKLRPDGTVKVLDFGLAKALETAPTTNADQSPTLTAAATQLGVIVGTAAYMAPEQAKGKPVDKRADVWAFGCVVCEMLTGSQLFAGSDVTETLAAVVRADPDWSALPPGLSHGVIRMLRSCLRKDPSRRLRDLGDARLALEGDFDGPPPPSLALPPPARRVSTVVAMALGLSVASVVATVVVMRSALQPSAADVTRFTVPLPAAPSEQLGPMLLEISPDGRTVVFAGADQLYRRDLAQLAWQPIPGTEEAVDPLFSPDGQWLAFEDADGLKLMPASGGPASTIVTGVVRGKTWISEEALVLAHPETGLFRIPAAGGRSESLTTLAPGETIHQPSDALPDGRGVLFTARSESGGDQIALLSLPDGGWQTLGSVNK